MNPFLWFQRLFVPAPESDTPDQGLEEENPFAFGHHIRIILAIIISIISAGVLWWIMI